MFPLLTAEGVTIESAFLPDNGIIYSPVTCRTRDGFIIVLLPNVPLVRTMLGRIHPSPRSAAHIGSRDITP